MVRPVKYIQSILNVSCLAVYISNRVQSCMVGVGWDGDAPKYWAVFNCESLVATFMYIRALIIWTPVIQIFTYPECILLIWRLYVYIMSNCLNPHVMYTGPVSGCVLEVDNKVCCFI